MSGDDEARRLELLPHVVSVGQQLLDSPLALIALRLPMAVHHNVQRVDDLLGHWGGHGARVAAGAVRADVGDLRGGAGDVAARRREALRHRPHQQVHLGGRHAEVVADAAAPRPHRADAVRLVDVQVAAVAAFELHQSGQVDDGALHAVHALHDDHYLAPGTAAGPGVSAEDRLADLRLQVGEVCGKVSTKAASSTKSKPYHCA